MFPGRPKHLRGPRRTLRPHPLHLRPLIVLAPRRAHHATQVLPQVQAHRQDPPHVCCVLCRLPPLVYDRRNLHATHSHRTWRRYNRETEPGTAVVVHRAAVSYPCWLFDGTCLHLVRPEKKRELECIRVIRLGACSRAPRYRPESKDLSAVQYHGAGTHRPPHIVLPVPQPAHRFRCPDSPRHLIRNLSPQPEVCGAKGPNPILWSAGRRREYVGIRSDAECGDALAAGDERVPDVSRG